MRPTLLRQMNMGSLTSAHIWVRLVHTKWGSGKNKSAQKLTLRDRKKPSLTLARQGIEPRVFGFEIRLSSHWATSPDYEFIIVCLTRFARVVDRVSVSTTFLVWAEIKGVAIYKHSSINTVKSTILIVCVTRLHRLLTGYQFLPSVCFGRRQRSSQWRHV